MDKREYIKYEVEKCFNAFKAKGMSVPTDIDKFISTSQLVKIDIEFLKRFNLSVEHIVFQCSTYNLNVEQAYETIQNMNAKAMYTLRCDTQKLFPFQLMNNQFIQAIEMFAAQANQATENIKKDIIKKYYSTADDCAVTNNIYFPFYALLSNVNPKFSGIAVTLCKALATKGFHFYPASISHHLNTPGGLLKHTVNVCMGIQSYLMKNPQHFKSDIEKVIAILTGLFHDISKTKFYRTHMVLNSGKKYIFESLEAEKFVADCKQRNININDIDLGNISFDINENFRDKYSLHGTISKKMIDEIIVEADLYWKAAFNSHAEMCRAHLLTAVQTASECRNYFETKTYDVSTQSVHKYIRGLGQADTMSTNKELAERYCDKIVNYVSEYLKMNVGKINPYPFHKEENIKTETLGLLHKNYPILFVFPNELKKFISDKLTADGELDLARELTKFDNINLVAACLERKGLFALQKGNKERPSNSNPSLNLVKAGKREFYLLPVRPDILSSDELMQIPGSKWDVFFVLF